MEVEKISDYQIKVLYKGEVFKATKIADIWSINRYRASSNEYYIIAAVQSEKAIVNTIKKYMEELKEIQRRLIEI